MRSARIALPLLAVSLLGCGRGVNSSPPPAERVTEVRVAEVRSRPFVVTITAVGTIEPEQRVVVAAQEEGLITALHVREGDVVRAGDVLARLDDREVSAQLEQATARLTEAEAAWGRAEKLVGEGLITEAAADTARAGFEVARAQVSALRTRASFTRITAPLPGVVTVRHVEMGDLVGARAPVVELAAGRTVLRVPVSELDVVRLAPGDTATVRVDALPGVDIAARVERVFPAANAASRQVTVELVLERPPAAAKPGFLARADLVVDRIPAALVIPERAVQRGSEVPTFVWVVEEGGTAAIRPVEVRLRRDGDALVATGLSAGEKVVVEGAAGLREGGKVRLRGEASS